MINYQIAYHGAPEKAYEVFVSALRDRYLDEGLIIPLLEDHNPAGDNSGTFNLKDYQTFSFQFYLPRCHHGHARKSKVQKDINRLLSRLK